MSKDTVWDHPDVEAATRQLRKALEKALRKQGGGTARQSPDLCREQGEGTGLLL